MASILPAARQLIPSLSHRSGQVSEESLGEIRGPGETALGGSAALSSRSKAVRSAQPHSAERPVVRVAG